MTAQAGHLIPGDRINYRHDDYTGVRIGTVTGVRTSHQGWAEIDLIDDATAEPYLLKWTITKPLTLAGAL